MNGPEKYLTACNPGKLGSTITSQESILQPSSMLLESNSVIPLSTVANETQNQLLSSNSHSNELTVNSKNNTLPNEMEVTECPLNSAVIKYSPNEHDLNPLINKDLMGKIHQSCTKNFGLLLPTKSLSKMVCGSDQLCVQLVSCYQPQSNVVSPA